VVFDRRTWGQLLRRAVYRVDADIVVVAQQVPAIREELTPAGFRLDQFAHSLNASKPGSKLQIHFTQDARCQDFVGRAERREVLGNFIPVATLEDIMQGKIWNGGRRNARKMNLISCALQKRFRNYALGSPWKS